jgi:DNA-binding MarR family transcriptional regulator
MKKLQRAAEPAEEFLDFEFLTKQGISINLDYIRAGALLYGVQKRIDILDTALYKTEPNKTMFYVLLSLLQRETKPHGKRLQPSEISKQLLLPRNTVSNALNQLEKQKLILRDPVKEDLRMYHISLTAKGKDITVKKAKNLLKFGESIFSCLDTKQMQQLIGLMKIILNNLK